jgi:hypothetical protein
MEGVKFIRPSRGPEVSIALLSPELTRKRELATFLRHSIEDSGSVINVDASTMSEIPVNLIGNDDTAWPRGPVVLIDHDKTFEVTLDNSFNRVLDDGSVRPGESIVIPLHATSIFFFSAHDRSNAWYCTAIITCEDERLLQGDPLFPLFVSVSH